MPRANEIGLELIDHVDDRSVTRVVNDFLMPDEIGSEVQHHRRLFFPCVITPVFPQRVPQFWVRALQRTDQKREDPVARRQIPLDGPNDLRVPPLPIHEHEGTHPSAAHISTRSTRIDIKVLT